MQYKYNVFTLQDLVAKYSQQMVKGMLQLLSNCPAETAHLRKELLIAAKHILTTDLRSRMYLTNFFRMNLKIVDVSIWHFCFFFLNQ